MNQNALTIAIGRYGVTEALKRQVVDTGRLRLKHIEIDPITTAMRRMVRGLEFDICEMAITTYLCAKDRGLPVTAIPVFVTRNFHHWAAFTTQQAGIKMPKDLEGRRVAVNRGYTVTTGVWVRGIFAEQYGLDLDRVTWVPTDDEHVPDFPYPANVDLSCRGKSAADLVLSGDCAAAIGDVKSTSPGLIPLIANARKAGLASYTRGGVYPINHTIVVRDALVEEFPTLAVDLCAAFSRSKAVYYTHLSSIDAPSPADIAAREIRDALAIEPFPFGVEANRPALEAIISYAVAQKIISRARLLGDWFALT